MRSPATADLGGESAPGDLLAKPLKFAIKAKSVDSDRLYATRIDPKHSDRCESAMPAAGKRKKKVETVFLVCEETGDHNYTIRRKMGGEKLKLKKFSPRLRKHTVHVEKKK
jgi:large subunit ribosomal protein L33